MLRRVHLAVLGSLGVVGLAASSALACSQATCPQAIAQFQKPGNGQEVFVAAGGAVQFKGSVNPANCGGTGVELNLQILKQGQTVGALDTPTPGGQFNAQKVLPPGTYLVKGRLNCTSEGQPGFGQLAQVSFTVKPLLTIKPDAAKKIAPGVLKPTPVPK